MSLPTCMWSGKRERRSFGWNPDRLDKSRGFGRVEIGRIERVVAENAALLLRSWHEYFGN